jgi:hypothetical protein
MIKALLLAASFLALTPWLAIAGGQLTQPPTAAQEDSAWGVKVTLRDGRILILGSLTDSYPPALANTVVLVNPEPVSGKL